MNSNINPAPIDLSKVKLTAFVYEYAGHWYNPEEKDFFNWQSENGNTHEIIWVESPNTIFSEDDVPNYEGNGDDGTGYEHISPRLNVSNSIVKTQDKRTK